LRVCWQNLPIPALGSFNEFFLDDRSRLAHFLTSSNHGTARLDEK
jgi:hypothetical protein